MKLVEKETVPVTKLVEIIFLTICIIMVTGMAMVIGMAYGNTFLFLGSIISTSIMRSTSTVPGNMRSMRMVLGRNMVPGTMMVSRSIMSTTTKRNTVTLSVPDGDLGHIMTTMDMVVIVMSTITMMPQLSALSIMVNQKHHILQWHPWLFR
jgi:hypothetical protein